MIKKYFLLAKCLLFINIAMSQIMLPAYQGVVSKIPTVVAMSCPGLATITDVDNNVYNTVLIGTQCWMVSNLRVTKYNNGTLIPLDNSGGSTGDGSTETWTEKTSGARTVYAHNATNLAIYGYLYNWYAVTDTRKICPTGWHVPSNAEWTTLTTFLGGLTVAGGKMKSTGTTYWNSPNTGADNSSGFSALPGGVRFKGANGAFGWIRSFVRFGSTSTTSTAAYFYQMDFDDINVTQGTCGTSCGHSVRCLRD